MVTATETTAQPENAEVKRVRECKCHSYYKRGCVKTINIDYCGIYYECTFCHKRGFTKIVPRWA